MGVGATKRWIYASKWISTSSRVSRQPEENIRTVPLQLHTCSNNLCYISPSPGMCMYRFASKRGSLHLFYRCLSNAINPCRRAGGILRCVSCIVCPLSVLLYK
ncbi:hypothetical protein IG631_15463 [Alternaria alternata]|nr:hypothetical protein IG631_15463 [Alternaria alternata]